MFYIATIEPLFSMSSLLDLPVPITFFTTKENTSFVLKQVDSYLRIVGEPKLPSSFLQVVIFLVLSIQNYSF
jgi:hypothetical protein